ncbi:MAG: hypothetical protein ACXV1K_07600, partial [Kineosporiaceae bacterium]
MARWPEIVLVANHVEACDDGWTASAFVVVRGTEAPMTDRAAPYRRADDAAATRPASSVYPPKAQAADVREEPRRDRRRQLDAQ